MTYAVSNSHETDDIHHVIPRGQIRDPIRVISREQLEMLFSNNR